MHDVLRKKDRNRKKYSDNVTCTELCSTNTVPMSVLVKCMSGKGRTSNVVLH